MLPSVEGYDGTHLDIDVEPLPDVPSGLLGEIRCEEALCEHLDRIRAGTSAFGEQSQEPAGVTDPRSASPSTDSGGDSAIQGEACLATPAQNQYDVPQAS